MLNFINNQVSINEKCVREYLIGMNKESRIPGLYKEGGQRKVLQGASAAKYKNR